MERKRHLSVVRQPDSEVPDVTRLAQVEAFAERISSAGQPPLDEDMATAYGEISPHRRNLLEEINGELFRHTTTVDFGE